MEMLAYPLIEPSPRAFRPQRLFMNVTQRRNKVLKFFKDHPFFQFQDRATTTSTTVPGGLPGGQGCTHTGVQEIEQLWKGVHHTHDAISAKMTPPYPTAQQKADKVGTSGNQVLGALQHLGLPYAASYNMPFEEVARITVERGPVILGVWYRYYPWQQGRGDHPNGSAVEGGRTDTVFEGGHAVVFASKKWSRKQHLNEAWVHDPDHGSRNRPERPALDLMRIEQVREMYEQFANMPTSHGKRGYTFVLYPTEALN
jgi:hypothetical protein